MGSYSSARGINTSPAENPLGTGSWNRKGERDANKDCSKELQCASPVCASHCTFITLPSAPKEMGRRSSCLSRSRNCCIGLGLFYQLNPTPWPRSLQKALCLYKGSFNSKEMNGVIGNSLILLSIRDALLISFLQFLGYKAAFFKSWLLDSPSSTSLTFRPDATWGGVSAVCRSSDALPRLRSITGAKTVLCFVL